MPLLLECVKYHVQQQTPRYLAQELKQQLELGQQLELRQQLELGKEEARGAAAAATAASSGGGDHNDDDGVCASLAVSLYSCDGR